MVLVNSQFSTPALLMHMTYSNRLVWPQQWHTQTRCADGLLLSYIQWTTYTRPRLLIMRWGVWSSVTMYRTFLHIAIYTGYHQAHRCPTTGTLPVFSTPVSLSHRIAIPQSYFWNHVAISKDKVLQSTPTLLWAQHANRTLCLHYNISLHCNTVPW